MSLYRLMQFPNPTFLGQNNKYISQKSHPQCGHILKTHKFIISHNKIYTYCYLHVIVVTFRTLSEVVTRI